MRAFTHHPLAIKVDNLYLVTGFFIRTNIFEWYVWFGVAPRMDANIFCLKDIGLSAQNVIIILSSIGIIIGDRGGERERLI